MEISFPLLEMRHFLRDLGTFALSFLGLELKEEESILHSFILASLPTVLHPFFFLVLLYPPWSSHFPSCTRIPFLSLVCSLAQTSSLPSVGSVHARPLQEKVQFSRLVLLGKQDSLFTLLRQILQCQCIPDFMVAHFYFGSALGMLDSSTAFRNYI